MLIQLKMIAAAAVIPNSNMPWKGKRVRQSKLPAVVQAESVMEGAVSRSTVSRDMKTPSFLRLSSPYLDRRCIAESVPVPSNKMISIRLRKLT